MFVCRAGMMRMQHVAPSKPEHGKQQQTAEMMERLKEVFTAHRGQTVVFLNLVDQQRTIKTEPQFWMNPTKDAIEALQNIVGKANVQVV